MHKSVLTHALLLTLLAGSPSLAGPEHKQHHDTDTQTTTHQSEKKTLEDFVGKIEVPDLFIGSTAPDLKIAKFVKGDPVDDFEKGQIYVVEFWATWCGPCITAFPHLSELQREHGDDVRFIGVDVFEDDTDQLARIERIEAFVEDQGERMSYTVAVEKDTQMADTWLRPAQQNSIPTAFIVDGDRKIAWIGHPQAMNDVLDQIVAGEFDIAKEKSEAIASLASDAALQILAKDIQMGVNLDDARQIADILINDHLAQSPQGLSQIAWMFLNGNPDKISEADLKMALKAAKMAGDATSWENWMVLATYAQALFMNEDLDGAVKWQKKTVELVPEEYEQAVVQLNEALKKYEAALEKTKD